MLILLALAAPARAGADAITDCNDALQVERQIRACSILIEDHATSAGNRVIALINRANAFSLRRASPLALADYTAAIAIDPDNTLAFYNRGNAHLDLGNIPDAIRDYSRSIALSPGFAYAYLNRGIAREQQGDARAAASDYELALRVQPEFTAARKRLQRMQEVRR